MTKQEEKNRGQALKFDNQTKEVHEARKKEGRRTEKNSTEAVFRAGYSAHRRAATPRCWIGYVAPSHPNFSPPLSLKALATLCGGRQRDKYKGIILNFVLFTLWISRYLTQTLMLLLCSYFRNNERRREGQIRDAICCLR